MVFLHDSVLGTRIQSDSAIIWKMPCWFMVISVIPPRRIYLGYSMVILEHLLRSLQPGYDPFTKLVLILNKEMHGILADALKKHKENPCEGVGEDEWIKAALTEAYFLCNEAMKEAKVDSGNFIPPSTTNLFRLYSSRILF